MAIERLKPRLSLDEERVRALEQVVPDAFANGYINWEVLRELLGERVEDENASTEHFGLFWPGKREARRLAAQPSKGTIVPALGEGVDEETTGNIFIEGDNLEVLKLLQKSYAGRIKMIYIDPPYNTGNDFIYNDSFAEPLERYLKRTGQMSQEGELWTTNSKDSGRFHSNWLNMMYPRVRLGRNLLREDGVMFVSIDDNEVHNLRQLMTEIFGEENLIATIVWQHSVQGKGYLSKFSVHHNYLLCYCKNHDEFDLGSLNRTDEHNKAYKNSDNDPKGPWRTGDMRNALYRPNLIYPLITPSGKTIKSPEKGWRYSKETMAKMIASGQVVFVDGETKVFRKIYLADQEGRVPETIWFGKDVGTTRDAAQELKDLFNGVALFETPKPIALIHRMMTVAGVSSDDLILDFFAGSGSTAHGVLEFNKRHQANLKFICIQLPQQVNEDSEAYKAGFKCISDITKERIRRAAKNLKKQDKQELKLDNNNHDFGFKVFKLSHSNFQAWHNYGGDDLRALEALFSDHERPFVEGWREPDVLTEILLIEGFPLNSKITPAVTFKANLVMLIESDFSAHRLFVCLEPRMEDDTLERVAELPSEDIFTCLDIALTDAAKVRLTDVGNVRTI